jgi:hypothetical protein
MLNKAWLVTTKREIPKVRDISSLDPSWWKRPEMIKETFEIMTFSRWGDSLNRLKDIWIEMHEIIAQQKTK